MADPPSERASEPRGRLRVLTCGRGTERNGTERNFGGGVGEGRAALSAWREKRTLEKAGAGCFLCPEPSPASDSWICGALLTFAGLLLTFICRLWTMGMFVVCLRC